MRTRGKKKKNGGKKFAGFGEIDLYIKLKISSVESFQHSGTMAHLEASVMCFHTTMYLRSCRSHFV